MTWHDMSDYDGATPVDGWRDMPDYDGATPVDGWRDMPDYYYERIITMGQIRNEWRYGDQDQIKVQMTKNVKAGDLFVVGANVIGIILNDTEKDQLANVAVSGVWEMLRTPNATQLTPGDVAYWDKTNNVVTTDASDNLYIGVIIPSTIPTETTCYVQLRGKTLMAS